MGQENKRKGSRNRVKSGEGSRKVFQVKGMRYIKAWWPGHLVWEEQRMFPGKVKRAGWGGCRNQISKSFLFPELNHENVKPFTKTQK